MECDRESGYVLSEEYWEQELETGDAKRVIWFTFEELQFEMLLVAHSRRNHQTVLCL